MSRNYKFHNPEGVYFVSFAVVNWIDALANDEYKALLIKCLNYCQQEKGMEIFAWCIMSNHMHLVFRSIKAYKPELLLGDFKRYTSKEIVRAIINNSEYSSKNWQLEQFKKAGTKSSNVKAYQFWQHDNKPIELWSNKVISEKINYIHNNPVEKDLVLFPKDYLYSSARDYAGKEGLVKGVVVLKLQ
jgi:REP element-mobilizing transposase RayT